MGAQRVEANEGASNDGLEILAHEQFGEPFECKRCSPNIKSDMKARCLMRALTKAVFNSMKNISAPAVQRKAGTISRNDLRKKSITRLMRMQKVLQRPSISKKPARRSAPSKKTAGDELMSVWNTSRGKRLVYK